MNGDDRKSVQSIAKHVEILNSELGKVQNDIRWMKKIMGYMAGIVSVAVGKIIFFS